MANANWFYYFDSDPFWGTTPIEKPEDCDCDKPGTLTDTLIGPLESFFGKEAEDDEIIGAESLPTTPQLWGVRWRPKWFPDGRGKNLIDANLRWADLRDADLSDADAGRRTRLWDANLWHADLRDANLRGASLRDAVLWDADLRDADLSDARLNGADLWQADLRDADLIDAVLRDADVRRADLRGADLRGADLWQADLRFADLKGARNLDQTINPGRALWMRTTCPDGSMSIGSWTIGTWPCFGDQLIPA